MTRRDFVYAAIAAPTSALGAETPLVVPVHLVINVLAKFKPEQLQSFWSNIWPEAIHDFEQCGIKIQVSKETGGVGKSPGGRPIFAGLKRGIINVVLTDSIPLYWDNGRALRGISMLFDGCPLSLIALRYAHGNRIPFLSVNTCVHELLHILMQDIFVEQMKWYQSEGREFRIDWYATQLWLFRGSDEIRKSAQAYLDRAHKLTAARQDGLGGSFA